MAIYGLRDIISIIEKQSEINMDNQIKPEVLQWFIEIVVVSKHKVSLSGGS